MRTLFRISESAESLKDFFNTIGSQRTCRDAAARFQRIRTRSKRPDDASQPEAAVEAPRHFVVPFSELVKGGLDPSEVLLSGPKVGRRPHSARPIISKTWISGVNLRNAKAPSSERGLSFLDSAFWYGISAVAEVSNILQGVTILLHSPFGRWIEGSSMRYFISGATDSKLANYANFRAPEAQERFMRTRAEIMIQTLFGRSILVPEGWSIDSIAFLKIATELLDAIERVQESSEAPEGIDEFDPFVAEIRGHGSYLAMLSSYMHRPDVRWSGLQPLRDDPQIRLDLAARLERKLTSGQLHYQHDLTNIFSEALDNAHIGKCVGKVARYFSIRKQRRIFDRKISRTGFRDEFSKITSFVASQSNYETFSDISHKPLVEFCAEVCKHNQAFNSSSEAMLIAEQMFDGDKESIEAIFHIINYSYLRVAAGGMGSEFEMTSPPVWSFSSEKLQAANSVLGRFRTKTSLVAPLDLSFDNASKPHVLAALREANWVELWEAVIRLALSRKWMNARLKLYEEMHGYTDARYVLNSPNYKELNRLLREETPGLCFTHSGMDQIGIRLPIAVKQRMESVGNTLRDDILPPALVGIAANYFSPGLSVTGILGLAAFNPIGKSVFSMLVKDEWLRHKDKFDLNPFSKTGPWSSRSTFLDELAR